MGTTVRLSVPRSNRNDNFIDKSFTVMADLIVKLPVSYTHLTLPTKA